MTRMPNPVEGHYGRGKLLDAILGALRGMGKHPANLAPADLAPLDEFHMRGREATVELAARAGLQPGLPLLDRADRTPQAIAWFEAALERLRRAGPPLLGTHLLTRPTVRAKTANNLRNLKEARIAPWQAVLRKP